MVWDPSRILPATWPGALEFYRHIEDRNHDFGALRQLVEHVGAQAYATSIFCATSGTSLLVAPAAGWRMGHGTRFEIDLDGSLSGGIRFVHTDPTVAEVECLRVRERVEGRGRLRAVHSRRRSGRPGPATGPADRLSRPSSGQRARRARRLTMPSYARLTAMNTAGSPPRSGWCSRAFRRKAAFSSSSDAPGKTPRIACGPSGPGARTARAGRSTNGGSPAWTRTQAPAQRPAMARR